MIFLPGNHDFHDYVPDALNAVGQQVLTHAGVQFAFMPLIPWIRGQWAREATEAQIHAACHDLIDGVDRDTVLVTHAPSYGVLDSVGAEHVGSKALGSFVRLWEPRLHLHGHIHEDNGLVVSGRTVVSNAACKGRLIEVWQ